MQPYQTDEPALERAKSPPLRSPTASPKPPAGAPPQTQPNLSAIAGQDDPWAAARAQRLPNPSHYVDDEDDELDGYTDLEGGEGGRRPPPAYNDYIGQTALQGGGVSTGRSVYTTSLRLPLRVEASLAYFILPPFGALLLLCLERQSDYVRFHAWQSTLLFSASFLLHVIFSWTTIVTTLLGFINIALIIYLVIGAWRNAETLDRVELPFFGRLASSFVDHD